MVLSSHTQVGEKQLSTGRHFRTDESRDLAECLDCGPHSPHVPVRIDDGYESTSYAIIGNQQSEPAMDSLTRQYSAHVMEVTAAYVTTAAGWPSELAEYQNSLDLEGIFDPQVLLSGDERQAAKYKVDCVARRLEQHKQRYRSVMVNYNRDVLACASALPDAEKAAIREPMIARLQDHLSEQAYFYQLRERWVTAVRGLIAIFDSPDQRIRFDGEQFLFEDNDELDHFIGLLTEIDEVAATEAVLMEARVLRMKDRAGIPGIHTR
jgi:hypothetical protein